MALNGTKRAERIGQLLERPGLEEVRVPHGDPEDGVQGVGAGGVVGVLHGGPSCPEFL
jgi:hypothetical protein